MTAAAAKRGVDLTSLSRPLRPEDLQRFDYILAMDYANKAAIEEATDFWAGQGENIPKTYRDKVRLLYYKTHEIQEMFAELNGCAITQLLPCNAAHYNVSSQESHLLCFNT
jgi:protein-tyrosine-phosphatase